MNASAIEDLHIMNDTNSLKITPTRLQAKGAQFERIFTIT